MRAELSLQNGSTFTRSHIWVITTTPSWTVEERKTIPVRYSRGRTVVPRLFLAMLYLDRVKELVNFSFQYE